MPSSRISAICLALGRFFAYALTYLLVCLMLYPLYAMADGQSIEHLRGGTVLIFVIGQNHIDPNGTDPKTANQKVTLHTKLSPLYGWHEAVVLHGPDGRVSPTQPITSRKTAVHSQIELTEPGLYTLRLKRSYDAKIWCQGPAFLAIKPSRYQTFFRNNTTRKVYFNVPEKTQNFTLSCTNRIGLRGEKTYLTITAPDGEKHHVQIASFSPGGLQRKLNLPRHNTNQELSFFSPPLLPTELLPIVKRYTHPLPGLWELEINGGELGVWLDEIPDLFFEGWGGDSGENIRHINSILSFFSLNNPVPVKASLECGYSDYRRSDQLDQRCRQSQPNRPRHSGQRKRSKRQGQLNPLGYLDRTPFLGAVGNIDPVRYHAERVEFGLQGDQIFLWPPKSAEGDALRVPTEWIQSDEPQMHSLVILRGREDWMRRNPGGEVAGFAEWGAKAVKHFIAKSKRDKNSFTVQVLSEPNLEMSVDEYCSLFSAVVNRFKQDPDLADVRLAGPGIGSGEEPDFIDWNWMTQFLKRQGAELDAVSWNSYKVHALQDTYLLAETVHQIKKRAQTLGIDPDILIGGINCMGGLAPVELFTGEEAGIWWAAALTSIINTGEVTGVWYFSLVDIGMRKKGLVSLECNELFIKPQGHVHKLFANTLTKGPLLPLTFDHDLIDGVAVEDNGGKRHVILVNKGWLPAEVDLTTLGKIVGKGNTILPHHGSINRQSTSKVELPPYTLLSIQLLP